MFCIKLCRRRLHNIPLDLNITPKSSARHLLAVKNSNDAGKKNFICWGRRSTQRLSSRCTLYKFVSSRLTAIKPKQWYDSSMQLQKTTQCLHLQRAAGPGRERSQMIPRDEEPQPPQEGPRREGSIPFGLCRMPRVSDPKASLTWILRHSHRRKVCEVHR